MTANDLSTPVAVGIAVLIAVLAVLVAIGVRRATGWAPSGGLALLIATPLVPYVPVASGFSLDDVLPLVGIVMLILATDLERLRAARPPAVLTLGVLLILATGLLSSIVNATGAASGLAMLVRGPGRYLLLSAIVLLVALAAPSERRHPYAAKALALLGTAEALFGLAAFFLPLGGIGLQPTRRFSVLYFEVPGRIAGTLGISPNFLGAIFVITILLCIGLAIDARYGRDRALWWLAALIQVLALTLTFTRASLGLMIVGVAVLLLIRGRIRFIAPVLLVVTLGFFTTPPRTVDPPVGPGGASPTPMTGVPRPPVAVERLTSDVPDRLALWASAAYLMIDHPVAGVGPGRTREVAEADPDRYVRTPFGSALSTAHNTILLAGAETGVAGAVGALLVNAALAWAALRRVFRGRRRDTPAVVTAASIAVLGYLAQGMVNNLFSVAAAGIVFAIVVGAFLVDLVPGPAGVDVTEPRAARGTPGPATAARTVPTAEP